MAEILVVDEDSCERSLIFDKLGEAGHTVRAPDQENGVVGEPAKAHDLLIVGMEAIRRDADAIQEILFQRPNAAVIITSKLGENIVSMVEHLRPSYILTKPIGSKELLGAIDWTLRGRHDTVCV